jgi:hypothetical protein
MLQQLPVTIHSIVAEAAAIDVSSSLPKISSSWQLPY